MRIGIIGAGQVGQSLAYGLARRGHAVRVANRRGPQTLARVTAETMASAVPLSDAVRDVDAVIVTIPMACVPALPARLFEGVPDSVAVIDTCNYYPRQRDGRIAAIEDGEPESQWVARQIDRPVIKAFNTIYAMHLCELGRPAGCAHRIALPVAGDDAATKATGLRLVDEMGFDAVDAGELAQSWRQQPGTPVYTADFDAAGVRRALAQASCERRPEWRATERSPGTFEVPA
jgi:predicted dinucleotide-binding enzyme